MSAIAFNCVFLKGVRTSVRFPLDGYQFSLQFNLFLYVSYHLERYVPCTLRISSALLGSLHLYLTLSAPEPISLSEPEPLSLYALEPSLTLCS